MAVEREVKLALLPHEVGKLRRHPLLADAPATEQLLESGYFDTPERTLAAAGIALRVRACGERFRATVKTEGSDQSGYTERNEWECDLPHELAARLLRGEGLADAAWLAPILTAINVHAVRERIAATSNRLGLTLTTRFRRTTWPIALVGGQAEVALDQGVIAANGETLPLCELEIESLSASPVSLLELALTLAEETALWPEPRSKAARGGALLEGRAKEAVRITPPRWHKQMSITEAFLAAWWAAVAQGGANLTQYHLTHDPEALHQLRVALRRSRVLIAAFAPWLGKPLAHSLREALATLAANLGSHRDRVVLLEEIVTPALYRCPVANDAIALLYRHLSARLRRPRSVGYRALGRLWLDASRQFLILAEERPAQLLAPFLTQRLHKARKRVVARLTEWHSAPTAEKRHRLRIALKAWRYLLEWSEPLLPERAAQRELARTKRALEVLGGAQDWQTATRLLTPIIAQGGDLARGAVAVLAWSHAQKVLPTEELRDSLAAWFAQPFPGEHP